MAYVNVDQQMLVATLVRHVAQDRANVVHHQLALDKQQVLTVMRQTMYVNALQV